MCQVAATDFRSPGDPFAVPSQARGFCRSALPPLLLGDATIDPLIDAAELAVSELATNAVNAGGMAISVEITVHHGRVRLAVSDDAAGSPRLRDAAPEDTHGRGLAIVARLGHAWGVSPSVSGKQVWVEIPLPSGIRPRFGCNQADPNGRRFLVDDGTADERLGQLLSVTDVNLSGLDPDQMLQQVLDRVTGILDTDTAAVLLVDGGSNELVARAACGLEEEVRQGVRVPIGAGFAGSIASQRKPAALDRVDSSTVVNPILWEKGIKTMLGAPLLINDELLGVLHVGRMQSRPFTQVDADVLSLAAERIAATIQTQRLALEAAAARMLERGLMPAHLPELPGVQFSARYVPAEHQGVGGDWYDAFTAPSGRLWFVVGDVAGHGLDAAVVMGRVKSAFRSYALQVDEPERVLELTDRKVRHFEMGTMVTVLCATAMPPYDVLEVSSAGHLPPVIALPHQRAHLVSLDTGPPLGLAQHSARTRTTFDVPDGALVMFYTDGLVERRDRGLRLGLAQLCEATTARHPEAACQSVMHHIVGNAEVADDIALLAFRRQG